MTKYYLSNVVFKRQYDNTENQEEDNYLYSSYEAIDKISLNYNQILAYVSLYLITMYNSIIASSNSILVINKYSYDPEEASALNKMTFFYLSSAYITGCLVLLIFPPKTENKYLNQFLWTYTINALMIYYSFDKLTYIISILAFGFVGFTTSIIGVIYLYDILPQRTHFYFFTLKGTDFATGPLYFVMVIYYFDFDISYLLTYTSVLLNGLILFYIYNIESPIKLCVYDKQSAEDSMNLMCKSSNDLFNFISFDPDTSLSKFMKTKVFYYKKLDIQYTDLILENSYYYVELENGEKEYLNYNNLKNESIKSNNNILSIFSSGVFNNIEIYILLTASFFQESLGIFILNNFQHYIKTYYIDSEEELNLMFIHGTILSLIFFMVSAYTAQFLDKWVILLSSSCLLITSSIYGTIILDDIPLNWMNPLIIVMIALQRWCYGVIYYGAVKVQMDYMLPDYKSTMQVFFMMVRCVGMLCISCSIYALNLNEYYSLLITFVLGILNIICYSILLIYKYSI